MPAVVFQFFKRAGFIVVLVLALSLSLNALTYINFDPHYGFLKLKQKAIESGWYLPFYYSHVLIGGIVLLIGIFQIFPGFHTRFPKAHKLAGYIYVMGILFFAAPGGLIMSFFIGRGPWVLVSFVAQSVLWFYFTGLAFSKIKKGDIEGHQQFMWRSYALTFAAITLRVYIFLVSWSVDLSQPTSYATLAWLSWLPNLLFMEGYIAKKRKLKSVLAN